MKSPAAFLAAYATLVQALVLQTEQITLQAEGEDAHLLNDPTSIETTIRHAIVKLKSNVPMHIAEITLQHWRSKDNHEVRTEQDFHGVLEMPVEYETGFWADTDRWKLAIFLNNLGEGVGDYTYWTEATACDIPKELDGKSIEGTIENGELALYLGNYEEGSKCGSMELEEAPPGQKHRLAFISVVNEFAGHVPISKIYLSHDANTGTDGDFNSTFVYWREELVMNFETEPWPTEFTHGFLEKDEWLLSLNRNGVEKSAKIKRCDLQKKNHLGWQKIRVDDDGYTMDWISGSCKGSWA